MSSVSDIKLIRTDTTLDLSQKAEKRCPFRSSGPRVVGSFPILDMVVAILSHPMMHLAVYARTEISMAQSEHGYSAKVPRTLQCL